MNHASALPQSLRDYIRRSGIALSVSSMEKDAPLILVNDAFCKLTGYTEAESLGQNCRFLQGPETSEENRLPMHDFVHGIGPDSGRFPILNYRKDGSIFRNFVFMTRLRTGRDRTGFILASQFDMTTALQRSGISGNDKRLQRALSDVEQIGREFGLAMMGSAQIISDSVATLAKLSFNDNR